MALVEAGMELTSAVSDGGVAHILDWNISPTSGKLLSLRTNGSELADVSYDGVLTIDGSGITNLDASNIASNTLADARIAQSNVTQHEAALSISTDQLTKPTAVAAGDLLIGNATNNDFDVAQLTEGSGVTITNNDGAITIAASATGIAYGDDEKLEFGAAPDYWFIYDSGNTRFELTSTDIDGGGSDGDIFRIDDGQQDVAFVGGASFGADVSLGSNSLTNASLAASLVDSGTFADARIAQSNVTQHEAAIDHDALTNFVGNEHVDHSTVSVTAGEGLTGGGDITSTRTLDFDINGLTAQASPTGASDYVAIWDAGNSDHRKVLLDNLPGGGGSTSPGGSDTQIQYNNGGSFGGTAGLTWDDANSYLTLGDDNRLQLGAAPDYWLHYDATNTRLALTSTDTDGGGADADILRVADGGQVLNFLATPTVAGTNVVLESRTLTGGNGIDALGDLSSDRTIAISTDGVGTDELDLAITPTWTGNHTWNDNVKAIFGSGGDAEVYYDGTDLVVDPQVVGSGDIELAPSGGNVGIGRSNPSVLLDMESASNPSVALRDTTQSQNWQFGSVAGSFRIRDLTAGSVYPFIVEAGAPTQLLVLTSGGKIEIGDPDTNLYRNAANELKTDDSFVVGADFEHLGSNVGFFGTTPATQPANTDDLKDALVNLGLYASGGATPLDLDGGALTAGSGTINGNLTVTGDLLIGSTHQVPILGVSARPDTSGDVFFEPYSTKASNDQWDHLVLVYNDTSARDACYGSFQVPQDYADTANVVIVWTTTATSGDVEWDFDYRAVGGDDAESLDQTGTQESVNTNDTAPSAAHERMETTIALTDGNFAAGDTVEFLLARDGTDAGDTISAAVMVFGVYFEYNES